MAETAAVTTPTNEGGAPPQQQETQVVTPAELKQEAKPTDKPAEPEKKAEPRFYERKVNGKVERLPAEVIDAAAQALGLDPTKLMSASQLNRASYERFEAAEKIRKESEALHGIKDPWKLAQQVAGLDDAALDKLAEDRVIAKMQREGMDPAQRQLLEEREALARERERIDADKKAQAESNTAAQASAIRERLEPAILDAAEKAGLPKTVDAVRAVVKELERQHRFGLPIDPVQAANDARDQFFRPSVSMLRSMPAEAIIRELGKEKYDEILRHSLQAKPAAEVSPAAPATTRQTARAYMTPRELEEHLRRNIGEG